MFRSVTGSESMEFHESLLCEFDEEELFQNEDADRNLSQSPASERWQIPGVDSEFNPFNCLTPRLERQLTNNQSNVSFSEDSPFSEDFDLSDSSKTNATYDGEDVVDHQLVDKAGKNQENVNDAESAEKEQRTDDVAEETQSNSQKKTAEQELRDQIDELKRMLQQKEAQLNSLVTLSQHMDDAKQPERDDTTQGVQDMEHTQCTDRVTVHETADFDPITIDISSTTDTFDKVCD